MGCTGGTGSTHSTGDEDNKLLGLCPRLVFNKSSGTFIGEVGLRLLLFSMAGHSLLVVGSCRCPQDLHCRPFLAATLSWCLSCPSSRHVGYLQYLRQQKSK